MDQNISFIPAYTRNPPRRFAWIACLQRLHAFFHCAWIGLSVWSGVALVAFGAVLPGAAILACGIIAFLIVVVTMPLEAE